MCDARHPSGEQIAWERLNEDPDAQRLLADVLDNLVELPERDKDYVRRQLLAFANCIRQITTKDVMYGMSDAMVNIALAAPQYTLKRMRREMDLREAEIRSKTSGDNSTSPGNFYDGSNG